MAIESLLPPGIVTGLMRVWCCLESPQMVKNLPAMQKTHAGSIPGLGRSPGGGNGNLLQYSCLENPTDRGAGLAAVHGLAKGQTRLSD